MRAALSRGGSARARAARADLFNMRTLLPLWTCWKDNVGSHVISLLQHQTDAEHQVVVLRALQDADNLDAYYKKIGATRRPSSRDLATRARIKDASCSHRRSSSSALVGRPQTLTMGLSVIVVSKPEAAADL